MSLEYVGTLDWTHQQTSRTAFQRSAHWLHLPIFLKELCIATKLIPTSGARDEAKAWARKSVTLHGTAIVAYSKRDQWRHIFQFQLERLGMDPQTFCEGGRHRPVEWSAGVYWTYFQCVMMYTVHNLTHYQQIWNAPRNLKTPEQRSISYVVLL